MRTASNYKQPVPKASWKYFQLRERLLQKIKFTAIKIAFQSPLQVTRSARHSSTLDYINQRASVDMKSHIKKVLNLHYENFTMDKYISSLFNLNNVNPTYVFRLPDKKNRTLVFRKSDFTTAVFPNITNVNKFKASNDKLEMSSSMKHPVKVKNEELLDELKHERFIFENDSSNNYDDYDDNMKKIVDANVRSEKDFIQLMNELNEDLEEEELREKYRKKSALKGGKSGKTKAKQKSEEEEWEELGLSGWTGSVSGSIEELTKNEK